MFTKDVKEILEEMDATDKYHILVKVRYIRNSKIGKYVKFGITSSFNGTYEIAYCETDIGIFTNKDMQIFRCFIGQLSGSLLLTKKGSYSLQEVGESMFDTNQERYLLFILDDFSTYTKLKLKL